MLAESLSGFDPELNPAARQAPGVSYGVLSFGRLGQHLNPIQNISGFPQGPAQPFGGTLIVRFGLFTTEGDRP
jgi:hypothetical protein